MEVSPNADTVEVEYETTHGNQSRISGDVAEVHTKGAMFGDGEKDERKAWAYAIDLLWQFSDGEDVDADALREALVRMSLRRHQAGRQRARNQEHIFVKASKIVREKAGLDRMTDTRREAIHEDYR